MEDGNSTDDQDPADAAQWGGSGRSKSERGATSEWPEPLNFLADESITGAPQLLPEYLPEAIRGFVFDTAERMGVDPAALALAANTALASVADDRWRIQPKRFDHTWLESPRIWGAIVGDPGALKTPIIRAATAPIDKLEIAARRDHEEECRVYRVQHKQWKDGEADPETEPRQPRQMRYLVENATVDALGEVLRSDANATFCTPANKVLIRHDELSELVAGFDRYSAGSKGGADRGAYLRLWNGDSHPYDRIGRGHFMIQHWSACILGGIQPEPIKKLAQSTSDDGLLQRFWYAVPGAQTAGADRVPCERSLKRYEALFPALAAMHPAPGQIVALHEEAHAEREQVLNLLKVMEATPDISPWLRSALAKVPGGWARLVLLFHLIEQADAKAQGMIAEEIASVAKHAAKTATLYLRQLLLPHLIRANAIMFSSEQIGHACWIAGYILSHKSARITVRDIVRSYRSLKEPEHRRLLLSVMETLEVMGWVLPVAVPYGRQVNEWDVNPRVHLFEEAAHRERDRRDREKERIRKAVAAYRKSL